MYSQNATFTNISVTSWWSILLVEETRVPGENYLLQQVTVDIEVCVHDVFLE